HAGAIPRATKSSRVEIRLLCPSFPIVTYLVCLACCVNKSVESCASSLFHVSTPVNPDNLKMASFAFGPVGHERAFHGSSSNSTGIHLLLLTEGPNYCSGGLQLNLPSLDAVHSAAWQRSVSCRRDSLFRSHITCLTSVATPRGAQHSLPSYAPRGV